MAPEFAFDQGPGDLFVVRVAGNFANEDGLASLEYAVKFLGVPLVVVLGHSNCGAVDVTEEVASSTPFAALLHFRKEIETPQLRVLLVAPMSGHFATLLCPTVKTMLPDHDVYITDWHNLRDVPLAKGRFAFAGRDIGNRAC